MQTIELGTTLHSPLHSAGTLHGRSSLNAASHPLVRHNDKQDKPFARHNGLPVDLLPMLWDGTHHSAKNERDVSRLSAGRQHRKPISNGQMLNRMIGQMVDCDLSMSDCCDNAWHDGRVKRVPSMPMFVLSLIR